MSTTKATRSKPPRHEVISVRLNQDRLNLLDRHRAALSRQLGREVSLGEAAFLVFEDRAAGVDRAATRDELLQNPTESLEHIRRRWDTEHALSLGEWDVLAEYVLVSTEEERQEPPVRRPAVPSQGSYLALLDAFEAVYTQRVAPVSPHADEYLRHLSSWNMPTPPAAETEGRPEAVREQIARQRRQAQQDTWDRPGNVGRCLLLAIHDEGLDAATLNRVLAPFWPTLWVLAARGHWVRHDHLPVRSARINEEDFRREIILPEPTTAGDFTVWFDQRALPDLVIGLDFGRCTVLLSQYPELVEFRAMLDGVPFPMWNGRYFHTVIWTIEGVPTYKVTLKASDTQIRLMQTEWDALGDLFRDAWQRPEIVRCLSGLRLEYGEHG